MGPLEGVRVVEFAGLGPGPFCGMLLADLGADVVRIDRRGARGGLLGAIGGTSLMDRGKRSIALDLKDLDDLAVVRALARRSDVLLEGFRPGVMERLGLGPDAVLARNPKLVYGRMTGWGQDGPLAPRAGHDINYIALAGVLNAFGRRGEAPVPPLNLVGDFGGGGMLLGFGIACALLEANRSGKGQVVDAAMVEGASLLAAMFHGFLKVDQWTETRGANILDTGAPWYDVYETSDAKYISIGAIEAKFYQELVSRLGLQDLPGQNDRSRWPELREVFRRTFKAKTREEWCKVFEGSDACFAPVLSFSESRQDSHNGSRKSYVEVAGVEQPAPAPRFSRTPGAVRRAPPERGEGGMAALREWGFGADEVKRLTSLGLGTRQGE